jgi:hypothetical protein
MKFADRVRQFLGETAGSEGDDGRAYSAQDKKKKAKKAGKVVWEKGSKSYLDKKEVK